MNLSSGMKIDGVELDGDLVEIGRKYFGLPGSVAAYNMDGRLILAIINISVPARDLLLRVVASLDVFHLFRAFRYTMDATDLIALVVLPLSVWWGYRVVDRQSKWRA